MMAWGRSMAQLKAIAKEQYSFEEMAMQLTVLFNLRMS